MTEYDAISRPPGDHCIGTTYGTLTAIDEAANTGTVSTKDWGDVTAEFHYHCEGMATTSGGINAFTVGDHVVMTVVNTGADIGTAKIVGFVEEPKTCGLPAAHISDRRILGDPGTDFVYGHYTLKNSAPFAIRPDYLLPGGEEERIYMTTPDFLRVKGYGQSGEAELFGEMSYYRQWADCLILPPFSIVNNAQIDDLISEWYYGFVPPTSTMDRRFSVEFHDETGLFYCEGGCWYPTAPRFNIVSIALTADCRFEAYLGPGFTGESYVIDGPGLWYYSKEDEPDLDHIEGQGSWDDWLRGRNENVVEFFGQPKYFPSYCGGHRWGRLFYGDTWVSVGGYTHQRYHFSTPPFQSLRVVDLR